MLENVSTKCKVLSLVGDESQSSKASSKAAADTTDCQLLPSSLVAYSVLRIHVLPVY